MSSNGFTFTVKRKEKQQNEKAKHIDVSQSNISIGVE